MIVSWGKTLSDICSCTACGLCGTRLNTVPGEGNPRARLMCIGEGPGEREDQWGRPFVGAAGQLLDKMLAAIDLRREDVYIANVIKCRPPGNRTPLPEEIAACLPFLRAQTALIKPRVILLLGATAARATLGPETRITRDRGKWVNRAGIWFMPTYHPAALLRDTSKKKDAWADLQCVRDKLSEINDTAEDKDGG